AGERKRLQPLSGYLPPLLPIQQKILLLALQDEVLPPQQALLAERVRPQKMWAHQRGLQNLQEAKKAGVL
ncbi:hypothetical protein ATR1_073c0020, partial [Acetobacter tropicalis]